MSDTPIIDLSSYVSDYCISITMMSDTPIIDLSSYVSDYCISITMMSDTPITVIYQAMSLTIVSVSLWWVIHPSQWFIKLYLWLLYQYHYYEWYTYHSDLSSYVWLLYQYHYDEWYTYHSDLSSYVSDYCISITMMSDTPITVIYQAISLTTVSVSLLWVIHLSQWFIKLCLTTVSVSLWWVIHLSQWFIKLCLWLLYQYHYDEWYTHHSDLSSYISDYCISITIMSDTPITVIYQAMSDYCISITMMSDTPITVIYQAMSLTTVSVSLWWVIHPSQWFIKLYLWLLYQYHYYEWYTYHSDLSSYVSDYCISITMMSLTTVSVSLWWVIHLSLIYQAMSLTPITVIYQAMSLTTVSVSLWWVIHPSQWFIKLCLWLLYQYRYDE